jgi:Ca2+-binding EF-hand superfamily protein
MKHADKTTKGYVSINNFLEKLIELTTETKLETYMRTFAMNVKRQGIVLKQELFKYDTARNGRLDKKTFAKAMN